MLKTCINLKKKFYLIILLSGFYCQSYALLQKMFIFYVNGIQNTQDEARINAAALDSTISVNSNMVNNNGRVAILYNKKGTLTAQTKDVLLQKDNEKISLDSYINDHLLDFGITDDRGERAEIRRILIERYYSDAQMGNNFTDLKKQLADQIGEPEDRKSVV